MGLVFGKDASAVPPRTAPGRAGLLLPCVIGLAVLAIFGLCLLVPPAWGQTPDPAAGDEAGLDLISQSSQAFKTAKRTRGLQTELSEVVFRERGLRPAIGGLSAGVFHFLLIAAGATILVIVFLHLRDNFRLRVPKVARAVVSSGSDGGREAMDRMSQARDSADELARAGDYIKAIHLLLLQSVIELRRRLNLSIASCLTSREILARTSLGPEAKKAFADIIGRVEVSYFGSHQPGREDYLACRDSFERLKANLGKNNGPPSSDLPEPSGHRRGSGGALPPQAAGGRA